MTFVDAKDFFDIYRGLNREERSAALEYLESDFDFSGYEVKFGYFSGCIVMRYYSSDVGYHFEAPIALSADADVPLAFVKISEYCLTEGIPETIIGIPNENIEFALRGAENYSKSDNDDGTINVRILTECMLEEELPEFLVGDVYIGEFAEKYADEYEKLIKNENLNCHFGYNLTQDMPNGTGADFVNFVREEFERGESMTFAATVLNRSGENVFVGEGALYSFDGRGGASVSFRVLPEYHRRGIGDSIFRGLILAAKQIGLKRVQADVKVENTPSLALLSKYREPCLEDEERVRFSFCLDEMSI